MIMDSSDLPARLMDEARRYNPAEHARGRLAPFREALLIWRAKSASYEQIAAALNKHGVKVSPAGVGAFCRRTLSRADILREQTRLRTDTPNRPAAPAPSFVGLSAVAPPVPLPPGRRGPRIARDIY